MRYVSFKLKAYEVERDKKVEDDPDERRVVTASPKKTELRDETPDAPDEHSTSGTTTWTWRSEFDSLDDRSASSLPTADGDGDDRSVDRRLGSKRRAQLHEANGAAAGGEEERRRGTRRCSETTAPGAGAPSIR